MTRISLALAMSLGVLPPAAHAAPNIVAWTTYLYAVPGRQSLAIDQVDRGVTVEVIGCEAGWCRIAIRGTVGFIAAESLSAPAAPAPWPLPSPACFVAGQVGHDTLVATRFCPPG